MNMTRSSQNDEILKVIVSYKEIFLLGFSVSVSPIITLGAQKVIRIHGPKKESAVWAFTIGKFAFN